MQEAVFACSLVDPMFSTSRKLKEYPNLGVR